VQVVEVVEVMVTQYQEQELVIQVYLEVQEVDLLVKYVHKEQEILLQ
jgi:hypothetical protein